MNRKRFIFAAGGTGGHLYPAIAVAENIKMQMPDAEILFVGTKDKLEAKVVPAAGYKFKAIWISGFSRRLNIKNILFPIKLFTGFIQALIINMKFKPAVAIGAGAYVSGPVIWGASVMGAKVILLEQNSYPGVTNRMLEKKADEIHISFEDSKQYFRNEEKLILTGNPVRINIKLSDKIKAKNDLKLSPDKKVLLVLGGSLGAASINEAVAANLKTLSENNIQIIWQTGKNYYEKYKNLANENIIIKSFIEDMGLVYSAADAVLARAGATTIAETAFLGLPVIFVPSTNVAANHQYKNAKSLTDKDAAILIEDKDLLKKMSGTAINLLSDEAVMQKLSENIKKFSKPDAAREIAERAIKMTELNLRK